MFGSLAEDKDAHERCIKSMELGILPDLFEYNALNGRNVLDDTGMSYAVSASGLLNERKPLITSYSAKNAEGNLPPFRDEGGRPESKGITSDGQEADMDDKPLMS